MNNELKNQIYYYLLRNHPFSYSRAVLVNRFKKPRTTIYEALHSLEKENLVEKEFFDNKKRGRPITKWKAKI